MKYFFVYMADDGKLHRKSFPDVASAVKWRKMWCNNYASLRFDLVRKDMEKGLDVKVDTIQKAEELFENLVSDAMARSALKSEEELRLFLGGK